MLRMLKAKYIQCIVMIISFPYPLRGIVI